MNWGNVIPDFVLPASSASRESIAWSGIAGMSVQHLSEIESSKRDPRLSSIERIADAMELAVMLVPEHMAPDIRRYIASQGRVFTTTQPNKETTHDDPT